MVLHLSFYVDDCFSGTADISKAQSIADKLQIVVNHGGFSFKGFTSSGHKPQESLSNDGQSISVARLKWYPLGEKISLDIQELNFSFFNCGFSIGFSELKTLLDGSSPFFLC